MAVADIVQAPRVGGLDTVHVAPAGNGDKNAPGIPSGTTQQRKQKRTITLTRATRRMQTKMKKKKKVKIFKGKTAKSHRRNIIRIKQ